MFFSINLYLYVKFKGISCGYEILGLQIWVNLSTKKIKNTTCIDI